VALIILFLPNLPALVSTKRKTKTKLKNPIKGILRCREFMAERRMSDALTPTLVVTVTVYGEVPSAGKLTDEGLIEQVAPEGAPPQERLTLPEKPSVLVALRPKVALPPGLTVIGAAVPREKSPAFPLIGTEKDVVFGMFVFSVSIPMTWPSLVGLNVTLIWQLPPAAMVLQLFV
jgi:hypothetical protein